MSHEKRELEEAINGRGERIKPGDLITAYRKGYHVVTSVYQWFVDGKPDRGYEINYRQVCDSNGVRSKHAKVEHSCNVDYCAPAQKSIDHLRKQANDIEATLTEYRKNAP